MFEMYVNVTGVLFSMRRLEKDYKCVKQFLVIISQFF